MVLQIEARIAERMQLQPLTEAERQVNMWQGFYDFLSERSGLQLIVPPLDRTEDEIKELEAGGRMLVYVHPQLSSAKAIRTLANILPGLEGYSKQSWSRSIQFTNTIEQHGWLDVERSIETPNIGLSKNDLEKKFLEEGLEPQTVNTYVIASEFSRFMTGKYFEQDADTNSLAFGTKIALQTARRKYVAGVRYFKNINSIDISHVTQFPDRSYDHIGGRSAGRKRELTSSLPERTPQTLGQGQMMSVEAFLDSLGIEDGFDRLERTVEIIDILQTQFGIEDAGSDTPIPADLEKLLRNMLQHTDDQSSETILSSDEEPSDADLALIIAEFGTGRLDVASADVPEVPIYDSTPLQPATEQGDDGQRFTTRDITKELFPNGPTLTQRAQANIIAKNNNWDPKNLTSTQRDSVKNALKKQYGV